MRRFTPPALYGVIGYPLGHSLSPLLHTTAFRELALPGVLVPWALQPEQVPAFIDSMRLLKIQGACVTLPHKISVIPLLDRVTERVRETGAVNLIYWDHDEGEVLCGDNTDVLG
ncbi:MAG: shikimate dehydrogenase, partial [Bilophila sp.]